MPFRSWICLSRELELVVAMSTTSANLPNVKDLTKQAPRSPRERIGGYAIMARMIDKGRASLNGTIGEYHFDCPLDNMLFGFKDIKGEDVRKVLESGRTDEQIFAWINANGLTKTPAEVQAWSEASEKVSFHNVPEKKEWFDGDCQRLGLDPAKASLFDLLEADDRASYAA